MIPRRSASAPQPAFSKAPTSDGRATVGLAATGAGRGATCEGLTPPRPLAQLPGESIWIGVSGAKRDGGMMPDMSDTGFVTG